MRAPRSVGAATCPARRPASRCVCAGRARSAVLRIDANATATGATTRPALHPCSPSPARTCRANTPTHLHIVGLVRCGHCLKTRSPLSQCSLEDPKVKPAERGCPDPRRNAAHVELLQREGWECPSYGSRTAAQTSSLGPIHDRHSVGSEDQPPLSLGTHFLLSIRVGTQTAMGRSHETL
jgi:hypothetical protein